MPLQDSFGKKVKPQPAPPVNRTQHLAQVPTIDELRSGVLTAMENLRQPVVLTWRRTQNGPMYLLTIIRNSDTYDPTWILNTDDKNRITVHWSYTTADPELIHSLITEKVLESGPAAVIPESLKLSSDRIRAMDAPAGTGEPQFFENYEIVNTIGKGGMGIIYKAKDRKDGSLVALKVLKTELMVDKSNVDRFKHEASNVHSLNHPNLVAIREFGLSRFGQPFITMDYLEGVELKALLEKQRQVDLPAFVNIFTQLCDALAYAHDKGLVHRDIKPGNIMLVKSSGGQDIVKIIDFGIAKSVSEESQKMTSDTPSYNSTGGQFLGSPGYMSPEQCAGAPLDKRSDIYSLGCVMYEAICGVLPFKYDNVIKTILAHVNEMPQPFAVVRPDLDLPEELEAMVLKCLEKDPEHRYQNARELCEDLWTFAAMGSSTARRRSNTNDVSKAPANPMKATVPLSGKLSTERPALGSAPSPRPGTVSSTQQDSRTEQSPGRVAHQLPNWSMARTYELSPLSHKAYVLLRRAGLLSDDLLKVVSNCEQLVDRGEITVDQAVAIVKHYIQQMRVD